MLRTTLFIGIADATPITAWAFVVRRSEPKVRESWVHSGTGTGTNSPTVAGLLALASGLQAIRERGLADSELTVWMPVREVLVAMTTPATPLGAVAAMLCGDCRDELVSYPKRKFRTPEQEENPADHLARWAWESATFLAYPDRPTGRRWLPAFTREVAV